MQSEKTRGMISLLLTSLIGASMGLFARWLGQDMALFQQIFFRILAGLLFGGAIFYRQISLARLRLAGAREWGLILVRSSALYLLGVGLGTQAYITAKYSNVAFISALPVPAIFGILLFREAATPRKILLILSSFAGALLIVVKDYGDLLARDVGELYALLSVVVFSFGIVTRKWHGALLNDEEISLLVLLVATLELLVTSLVVGESMGAVRWSMATVVVLGVAGLFNALFMLLVNYGFHKVDAMVGNNILATQPLVALLLGGLLFGDVPTRRELFGGAMIFISLILIIRVSPGEEGRALVPERAPMPQDRSR